MTDAQVEVLLKRLDDADCSNGGRTALAYCAQAADAIRDLRAALAAAQAGAGVEDALAVGKVRHASYRFGYQNGFAAGIEAVCTIADRFRADDACEDQPFRRGQHSAAHNIALAGRALPLPAAQAAPDGLADVIMGSTKSAHANGFSAGIEAAAQKALLWPETRHQLVGKKIAEAIRALRPPAAAADEPKKLPGEFFPLTASEPAVAAGNDICTHDLAEKETACADGMCPLCLAANLDLLRSSASEPAESKHAMTDDAIEEVARLMFEREPKHQGDTARPRWSWDEIQEESRQYWRNFAKITRNIFARPPPSASEPAGAPKAGDWLDLRGKHHQIDYAAIEVRESTGGVGWAWRTVTKEEIAKLLRLWNEPAGAPSEEDVARALCKNRDKREGTFTPYASFSLNDLDDARAVLALLRQEPKK